MSSLDLTNAASPVELAPDVVLFTQQELAPCTKAVDTTKLTLNTELAGAWHITGAQPLALESSGR